VPDYSDSVCAMLLLREVDLERIERAIGSAVTAPNPHVTLFYLGKAGNFTDEQIDKVREWAQRAPAVSAWVTGVERFEGDDDAEVPIVLTLESEVLTEVNTEMRKSLKSQGVVSESKFASDYKPHLTISYGPKTDEMPLKSQVRHLWLHFEQMHFQDGKGNDLYWPLKKSGDELAVAYSVEPEEVVELTEFSTKERKTLAKKGQALPGGGFPIRNESDLRHAIQAFGRAKNPEATKRHIKARARALGLTHLLPASWKDGKVAASHTDEDSAIVKLAKITRVEAHRRRRKTGQNEQVDTHIRKLLDAAGIGSEKTKKGAVVGKGQAAAGTNTTVKKQQSGEGGGDLADLEEAEREAWTEGTWNRDAAAAAKKAAVDPTIEPEPGLVDVSSWKKVGKQGGSNPGGTYVAPDGSRFYIKQSQDDDHARNEVLASRLYNEAGIEDSGLDLVDVGGGKLGTASPIIDGAEQNLQTKLSDKKYLAKLQEGFAVDAWLANWDVAGLVYDNVVTDSKGDPIRVDPGGALLYRGMGESKGGAFGDEVGELETFRNGKSKRSTALFGSMTDDQIKKSAQRVADITPERIAEIVDGVGFDPETADLLKQRLTARQRDLLEKVGLLDDLQASRTDDEDSAIVKLAKITRVEQHRRRNRERAGQHNVKTHLRKILDAAGFGSEKTKKGAFTGGQQGGASTTDLNREERNSDWDDDAARAEVDEGGPSGLVLKEVKEAKPGAVLRVRDRRLVKKPNGKWRFEDASGATVRDDLSDAEVSKLLHAVRDALEKNVKASHEFTKAEVLELRLAGLNDDDINLIALGSRASLDRSPKKNWVENTGELPGYVREIARSIERKRGVPLSRAIALAIGAIKRWARGGGDVDVDTRAKAAAALASWEALKARNKARKKD
jgi:2'-5' RNA ligase